MSTVDIICLANSRKLGGKCVAGVRLDGRGWVRLVSGTGDGSLSALQCQLSQVGREVQVLDIISVRLLSPSPKPHQPENWLIADEPWRLARRPLSRRVLRMLDDYIVHGPELLRGKTDRVPFSWLSTDPAEASLALVEPENLCFYATHSFRGKPQLRATFRLGSQEYNLVVTDVFWEGLLLSQLPVGVSLPFESMPELHSKYRVLLTISLGEPLHGYCYKLVAAVILLPRSRGK